MAFWDTLQNTVKAEIDLKMEQGYDVEEFQKAFAKAGEDEGALRAVYENLAKAERQRNYPYLEPQIKSGCLQQTGFSMYVIRYS